MPLPTDIAIPTYLTNTSRSHHISTTQLSNKKMLCETMNQDELYDKTLIVDVPVPLKTPDATSTLEGSYSHSAALHLEFERRQIHYLRPSRCSKQSTSLQNTHSRSMLLRSLTLTLQLHTICLRHQPTQSHFKAQCHGSDFLLSTAVRKRIYASHSFAPR